MTVVVHLKCIPAMVIGVRFSICVGAVVGETFFGDATVDVNGGSFTWVECWWQFIFLLIFKAYYVSVDFKSEMIRVKYVLVHN